MGNGCTSDIAAITVDKYDGFSNKTKKAPPIVDRLKRHIPEDYHSDPYTAKG